MTLAVHALVGLPVTAEAVIRKHQFCQAGVSAA